MTGTDVLPLLNKIAASSSIDEAWGLATDHFASMGFKRANYGYTRFRHLKTIGDPDDALFLTTCDADFVKRYFLGAFYAKTPVFRWAERNSGACTWTWVKEAFEAGRLAPDEAEAVRETVAILKEADLAPLEVQGLGTLEERLKASEEIDDEERFLMERALKENSVIVAEITPFFD